MFELESGEYTILSKIIMKPTLLNQTYITYTRLLEQLHDRRYSGSTTS